MCYLRGWSYAAGRMESLYLLCIIIATFIDYKLHRRGFLELRIKRCCKTLVLFVKGYAS